MRVQAHLVPFDDVFELTGLFLLDVWRQEDDGSSQAVILKVHKLESETILSTKKEKK